MRNRVKIKLKNNTNSIKKKSHKPSLKKSFVSSKRKPQGVIDKTEKESINSKIKIRHKVKIKNKSASNSIIDNKELKTVSLEKIKEYCNDKSVLIVGNSKDIIESNYGKKIDSYDIVIRLNHGHIKRNYRIHMGRKYNIWGHGFLNKSLQKKEYSKIKSIIDYHIATSEKKVGRDIKDEKCFIVPSQWYKKDFESKHKRYEMSTGLNVILLFSNYVNTMKSLSIVGFDFLRTSNSILLSSKSRWHNSEIEENIAFNTLLNTGKYIPFNEKYEINGKR